MSEKSLGHFDQGVSRRPLQDQRVVIVGGTSGMGLGSARAAVEAGAEVIVVGRRPKSSRESSSSQDVHFKHGTADITNEASVRALFEEIGQFDHLLITAAPASKEFLGEFAKQDLAKAQGYLNAKFFGSWLCARYAAPKIRSDGSITFLTGCSVIRPHPGGAMITATFAALEAFARVLALEMGPLRVNTIRPGLVESECWNFLEKPVRDKFYENARAVMPVRRIGSIQDIGHCAVFIMTNPYISGTTLEVSGGETLISLTAPV
jgi:NAD(P)-dependent dehydrogenase (short-subunit alcohol dehydrogenase family)